MFGLPVVPVAEGMRNPGRASDTDFMIAMSITSGQTIAALPIILTALAIEAHNLWHFRFQHDKFILHGGSSLCGPSGCPNGKHLNLGTGACRHS